MIGRKASRREGGGSGGPAVDMAVEVGGRTLPDPVMTAAGTSGYGAELAAYFDLSRLGAVVVKSLSADPWPGNPAPRIHATPGLSRPTLLIIPAGVDRWLAEHLQPLERTGARIVVSIWGRSVADYARAARMLAAALGPGAGEGAAAPGPGVGEGAAAPGSGVGEGAAAPGSGSGDSVVALKPGAGKGVVALEVNVSCPNLEERSRIFAHDPDMTAAVVGVCAAEVRGRGLPVWAKLSPNVTDLVPIVDAAMGAGASAVTLGNTLMGLVIDTEARRPLLGGGGGGLSGPAVRAVAVRNVFEVHARRPEVPIIGVGGIASGRDAVEYLMAGARAVQVGTATFADPRASTIVSDELTTWCETHGVGRVSEIIGAAHEH